jgi:hypothetical protein
MDWLFELRCKYLQTVDPEQLDVIKYVDLLETQNKALKENIKRLNMILRFSVTDWRQYMKVLKEK